MKHAVCFIYYAWLAHVVATKHSPWVRVIDRLWGGDCKYCVVTRALLAGVGVGLLFRSDLYGLVLGGALIALSFMLTWVETHWLCTKPTGETK